MKNAARDGVYKVQPISFYEFCLIASKFTE